MYYDPNSGIYFYYDHNEEKYVFHSQVTPQAQEQDEIKKRPSECSKKTNEDDHVSLKSCIVYISK